MSRSPPVGREPLVGPGETSARRMLQLASLPAVRRGGRPAPDVREPIELQAGILAERRKAPAPAEEPSKATDRSSLVSAPHVAPPRPGTLLRGQLK